MKISINISEVLTKAWKITWKFKILWLFGILAGFGSSSGDFNSNFNSGNSGGSGGSSDFDNAPFREFFRQFERLNPQEAFASFLSLYGIFIIAGVLFLCVFSLIFYFLGVMGKIGLTKGAQKADLGAEKLGFGEIWRESLSYFWRTFGLSLLTSLPILFVAVIVLVALFAGLAALVAPGQSRPENVSAILALAGILFPMICCLGLSTMVIDLIVEQAKLAIIIEDIGVIAGLKRGWDVLKKNFLTIILLSILLSVLLSIIGFVVAIPMLLALAPAGISFVMMMADRSMDMNTILVPLAISGICLLVYSPVLMVFSGVVETYRQTVFTLTYLRVTAPPLPEPPVEPIHVE